MFVEEGTRFIVCLGKVGMAKIAEFVLLLVHQKSSNPRSGIIDIETIYDENTVVVLVLDSKCKCNMHGFLADYGKVESEQVAVGVHRLSHKIEDRPLYGVVLNE